MSPRYDEAPEVALQYFPEVHHPPTAPELATEHKVDGSVVSHASILGFHASTPATSPFGYSPSAPSAPASQVGAGHLPGKDGPRRICACRVVTFILSVILAVLSVALIALAAGTAVAATRARDAEDRLARLSANIGSGTTSTSDSDSLARGCAEDPTATTGSSYMSSFFGQPTFVVHCDKDARYRPLMSLFVGNMHDCIDACAAYSSYTPGNFPNATTSGADKDNNITTVTTCAAVSFVPLWTNRTMAVVGAAPGNCYLKPGPQNASSFTTPDIGTACHAAILSP